MRLNRMPRLPGVDLTRIGEIKNRAHAYEKPSSERDLKNSDASVPRRRSLHGSTITEVVRPNSGAPAR